MKNNVECVHRLRRWLKKVLQVMKIGLLLFVLGLTSVNATTFSQQKVSFDVKDQTLVYVLDLLQEQSDYTFLFSSADVRDVKVSMRADGMEVFDVLRKCLDGTGIVFEVNEKLVVLRKEVASGKEVLPQQKTVRVVGKVTDEKKQPLPGVTVIVKGSGLGTATDVDGKYVLNIPGMESFSLLFSFVGMESREIKYTGQDTINVVLKEDMTALEDVVVTGIFRKPKSHFTGAANTFTKEELQQVSSQNLLATLSALDPSFKLVENIAAGSNPNVMPDFQIRGSGSISGLEGEYKDNPNEPTFILDGFEVSMEKIFDLDPERVESITILKDAAATAIYGSRAANGVVVVETKALAMGELKVSYNFVLDMDAADLSDYNLLNAEEKLRYEKAAKLYTHSNVEQQEKLLKKYNDRLAMVNRGVNTDWMALPLRDLGVGQRHSLLLEGGDSRLRYGLSLNYNNKVGAMRGSKRNNLGVGIKLQYNYKNLRFLNNLTYESVRSEESPYGSFSEYVRMNPYFYPWDENGNVVAVLYESDKVLNPLYNATLNTKNARKYDEFVNNFSVEWTIMDNLRLTGKLSLNRHTEITDDFKPGDHTDFYGKTTKGSYTKGTLESSYYEGSATLSYSKRLEQHLLVANAGFNVKETKSDLYRVKAVGFPNDKMEHVGMGTGYEENSKPTGVESISRLMGFIGNLNYSYDDRYLLDASFRFDGSSQFGSDKRWGMFWSAGAGWNIHKEAFLKDSPVLSLLKLRASIGYTGSQKFNPYQALMMYRYLDFAYGDYTGAELMAMGNDALKWQRTNKRNIGVDFEFFDGRIGGSFNYYNEYSKDVLTDITLAPSLGFDNYKENLGELKNTGYELSLKFGIIKNIDKGLLWNISASAIYNKNELMKINNALTAYNDKVNNEFGDDEVEGETDAEKQERQTSPRVKFQEGQSMNTIWCVRSLGIDPATGSEVFLDRNGNKTNVYNPADQVAFAVTDPKLEGNLGTNITYKSFQLNAYFNYKFGGYIYNQTLVNRVENVNPNYNVDARVLYDRWIEEGDVSKFKSISDRTTTKPTSRFVEKENVFACKSINLSYTFPKERISRIGLERLKLTFYANDVFRISTVKQERGLDYPFARNYTFGLQATF